MPQSRWPIITTSISGIPKDVWDRFKKTADGRGVTDREAAEAAIGELAAAVKVGERIEWQPAKSAPPHSLRAHEDMWAEVAALTESTGFRQNVVIMTAMLRWLEKE
jgi:plastocyanin